MLALLLVATLVSTGGVAAAPNVVGADNGASAQDDGVSVEEGEIVCEPTDTSPVNCAFVGAEGNVNTNDGSADADAGAATWDKTGQQTAAVTTEASADGSGIDAQACVFDGDSDFCVG